MPHGAIRAFTTKGHSEHMQRQAFSAAIEPAVMPAIKCARRGGGRCRSRVSPFGIMVMATVSAGKSSVINAMIGRELLHAANEATTATVTRVEHRKESRSFSAACYAESGDLLHGRRKASTELMREWNADPRIASIAVTGCFPSATRVASGLFLYDTPGPNNSRDKRHGLIAQTALRQASFDALFYILNAGQIGTTDDRAYLDMLRRESRPEVPIYFLLNKVDLLDSDKGETVDAYVRSAHRYAVDAGFDNAVVIPTVADVALYARKTLNGDELTRVQRLRLRRALEATDAQDRRVIEAAMVPDIVRARLFREVDRLDESIAAHRHRPQSAERSALKRLVTLSGIRTVETLVQHKRSLLARHESN